MTITGMLDQFVGEQRTAMKTAFEAACAHATAACAANVDNATCMAEKASAVSHQLQVHFQRHACLPQLCVKAPEAPHVCNALHSRPLPG